VYRAVDALRRELKNPRRGGTAAEENDSCRPWLGGGSSDAAAALLGYLRLTRKKLARRD